MARRQERRDHQGPQCVLLLLSFSPARVRKAGAAEHGRADPATEEELGTVPEMGLDETKQAIDAAARAFTAWSKTTPKVRPPSGTYHCLYARPTEPPCSNATTS